MSNTKNLLNENTIRRFMKLAEIDTLSDGFVTGLVKEQAPDDVDFEGDAEFAGDTGPEAELDVAPEESPVDTALATEIATGVASVLEDTLGVSIQVEGEGEEEVELGDLGPEEALPGEEEAPLPAVMAENQQRQDQMIYEEKLRRQAVYQEDLRRQAVYQEQQQRAANYRNAVKNEVFRRVSARLQQESRKDAVADQLSERILRRIKDQSKR